MRIGYPHPDRLISYPDPHNLSIWRQPIRMRSRRRHRWTILEGNALGRAWLRCPWAAAGPGWASRRRITTQHRRRRRCGGRRRVRRAWLGFETAHHHPAPQAPPVWRAPEGPEGTGGLRDRPLRAFRLACGDLAGGRTRRCPEHHRRRKQQAQPRIPAAPPVWRAPRGLQGLAGLRDDAPSEARGADGERAGRPRGGRRSGEAASTAGNQNSS